MVVASKGEAALAVKLYNEPTFPRALEGFVVHMHLAWMYLLHAEFNRAGIDFRFPDAHHKGWFEKVDGEHKTWDLAKCIREKWPRGGATRANLEFFVLFRNKIEHRYSGSDEALFAAVSGKSHALLLNYEEELTTEFGGANSLANVLRFPVFIGTFTEPAEQALIRLQRSLPADLHRFLAEYDSGIEDVTRGDSHYTLRLRVLLETGNKGGDMALQFDRYEDLTDEQKAAADELGKTGRVLVRQQDRPVQYQNLSKPSNVVAEVSSRIPYRFTSHDFMLAWRKGKVRPAAGAKDPKRTRAEFCLFDSLHGDYGYTRAYIEYLVRKCSTEEGFVDATGREARRK